MTPRIALHLLIAGYTGLHLMLAAVLPLAAHEAHYSLYGRELQLSYLDHPPLAAWLQALVELFSTSDFAMRLLPIGLSVTGMYLLARLARVLYPEASSWLPFFSVLALQGTLVFHGSMTLSPDAVLLPLGLLAMIAVVRALETDRLSDWILLGVAVGLAGLSKYTAVTVAISVVVALIISRGFRGLTRPGPWLAGGIALIAISPVLIWNWQNEWATVSFHSDYQFDDVERWSPTAFLENLATQVAYYSPLVVLAGIPALFRTVRGTRKSPREWLVPVFVLPVLVLYLYTALESRASPHWSMLGWLFLIPTLVLEVMVRWQQTAVLRWLTWLSAGYSVALLVAIAVIVTPLGRWPDYRHPARLVVGWQEAAERGDALRRALPPDPRYDEPVLLARNWHHAGLLAWYAPGVPVRNLFLDLNPHNYHWGYADHRTRGVLVYPRDTMDPVYPSMVRDFDCTPIDSLPIYYGESLLQVFHFYACNSLIPPRDPQKDSPTPT